MSSSQKPRLGRWLLTVAVLVLGAAGLFILNQPQLPATSPRVLVSVDRTLWNRLGFNQLTFVRALRAAGLQPTIVDFERRPDQLNFSAAAMLEGMDALVLSGGGDVDPKRYESDFTLGVAVNPRRDSFEIALLAQAEKLGIPVLGICRGAQLINVYRGGSLNDFRTDGPRFDRHQRVRSGHAVDLEPDSRLAAIFGTQQLSDVVTWHGQYIDRPGEGVRIVGYAPDGTPEAIEVTTGSAFGMLGVQWHAEAKPGDPLQQRLFSALRDAAVVHQNR